MSQLKYLLDSTLIIDHFNDIPKATQWIKNAHPKEVAVSSISIAEVLTGFAQDDWQQVEIFFQQFTVLNLDYSVSLTAARLRQIYHFKLPDAFQAALAVNHGIILITRNSKDFQSKKHQFVKIPYTL